MREFNDVFAIWHRLKSHPRDSQLIWRFFVLKHVQSMWLELPLLTAQAIAHFLIIASLACKKNTTRILFTNAFCGRAKIFLFSHFKCGRQIAANRLDVPVVRNFRAFSIRLAGFWSSRYGKCAKTFFVYYSGSKLKLCFTTCVERRQKKGGKSVSLFFAFIRFSVFFLFILHEKKNVTKIKSYPIHVSRRVLLQFYC